MDPLSSGNGGSGDNNASPPRHSSQAVTSVPVSRTVPRPVPEAQTRDPRHYELAQLRRRYRPSKEITLPHQGTRLNFKLPPSDPDFPFDLDFLECELDVPVTYPKVDVEGGPTLKVKNKAMPRGFQINVEKGWEDIVSAQTQRQRAEEGKGEGVMEGEGEGRRMTLAEMVRRLDYRLEALLGERKAETVKLVQFKDHRHLEQSGGGSHVGESMALGSKHEVVEEPKEEEKKAPVLSPLKQEFFTRAQVSEAKMQRATQTRMLEARMGRLDEYKREADGVVYTLPFDSSRGRIAVPYQLKAKLIHVIVPLLYPLESLRVQLVGVTDGVLAEKVEDLFVERTKGLKGMTLTSLVNWLSSNVGILAKEITDEEDKVEKDRQKAALMRKMVEASRAQEEDGDEEKDVKGKGKGKVGVEEEDDRSHIVRIPPPEWSFGYKSPESSESEDCSDGDEEDEQSEDGQDIGGNGLSGHEDMAAEKGTSLLFPGLQMREIEVLRISSLGLRVKCERCKTSADVTGLESGKEKSSNCGKCGLEYVVRFRHQLMHENNKRAGFIDVVGCSVVDMLASTFVPTCARCPHDSSNSITCVRGDTITNVCRECHTRFTLSLPELKFQVLTPPLHFTTAASVRCKNSTEAWRAGEPLLDRGACPHYRRSFRWFRFNCCKRVYPCDQCHDAAEDGHVHEWADRMVCGFCGREGRYKPDSCGFCGRSVISGKGSQGFWEGGKGTRNRATMRRKDTRKFKRVGGGEMVKEREKKKGGT